MIQGYPNDVKKLKEKLDEMEELRKKAIYDILWKTKKLIETGFTDQSLKRQITDSCDYDSAHLFHRELIMSLIEFIELGRAVRTEDFKEYLKKECERLSSAVSEDFIVSIREKEETMTKSEEDRMYKIRGDYEMFDIERNLS